MLVIAYDAVIWYKVIQCVTVKCMVMLDKILQQPTINNSVGKSAFILQNLIRQVRIFRNLLTSYNILVCLQFSLKSQLLRTMSEDESFSRSLCLFSVFSIMFTSILPWTYLIRFVFSSSVSVKFLQIFIAHTYVWIKILKETSSDARHSINI